MLTVADRRSCFADEGAFHLNSPRENHVSDHDLGGTKPTDVRPTERTQFDLPDSAANARDYQCHSCLSRSSVRGLGRRSFTHSARGMGVQKRQTGGSTTDEEYGTARDTANTCLRYMDHWVW
jgi:hypothetical protein